MYNGVTAEDKDFSAVFQSNQLCCVYENHSQSIIPTWLSVGKYMVTWFDLVNKKVNFL